MSELPKGRFLWIPAERVTAEAPISAKTLNVFRERGRAFLVIVAEDASENTRKRFQDKCTFYEIPCFVFETRERLGRAIGKELRASLAIGDENLAGAVEKLLRQLEAGSQVSDTDKKATDG